jgi:hypothetical protein
MARTYYASAGLNVHVFRPSPPYAPYFRPASTSYFVRFH